MAQRFIQSSRLIGATIVVAVTLSTGPLILGHSNLPARGARPAAQGATSATGSAENGQKAFTGQKCAGCHGPQGQGGSGAIKGPQLAPPRLAPDMFLDAVRNAKSPMPAYSSSEASDVAIADIYAFLKSVAPAGQNSAAAPPPGHADNGKQLFVYAGCYECHDRQGQGGAGTGPRLAPNPIAFAAFMHQCRQPSNEMPPYTGKVLSDSQLADIYAFLQSIPPAPAASSIPLLQ